VVQDTITEEYWDTYVTFPTQGLVDFTIYTYFVSNGTNGPKTVSNTSTITLTNTSYEAYTYANGVNPLLTYPNQAITTGLVQTNISLTGNSTITAGVTV
jgi:hypothetical protein